MSLADLTVTAAEVAQALRITEDELRRRWRYLHKHKGFPHKLNGWVWARASIEAWIAADGAGRDATPAEAEPPIGFLAANQNRSLAARYAGGRA